MVTSSFIIRRKNENEVIFSNLASRYLSFLHLPTRKRTVNYQHTSSTYASPAYTARNPYAITFPDTALGNDRSCL